jgi:PAS domain S-box-containing protein
MNRTDQVNILMVDDQPAKLLSYETILAELDENLIRANSGNEALEYLLKMDIAVVLVDVCMPGLDGFELASMIRSHPRFQKTAIILVSGVLVEDSDRLKGYDSGAVDYVSVPIIPEILRAKVSVFADLFRKSKELQELNRELEQRVAERTAQIGSAAARLQESEEKLRLLLTSSGMRGWTWDIALDEVRWVTPSGEPERQVGKLADFLEGVHPKDRALVRDAFHHACSADGREYHAEFRVTDGGDQRWILGRGTVIRDGQGHPASIAGINIDITDRKRAEEERAILLKHAENARGEAETANRLKDEFLATLSHELRTPLNAIMGWSHMLHTGMLDPAGRVRAVEAINRNAELQTKLISDILDVSRIITGKLRLSLEPVHPRAVIEAALDTVQSAAEAKGVRLEADLTDDAGIVMGDPARLQQVMWNLVANAIKFAPTNGHVQIKLATTASHVEITVQDDGPGIEPRVLPYIFDRFRQGDSSSTRPHHGLGLGLAIVRHLLEMHGGDVQAANRTDGSGAVFKVTLRRRASSADAIQDAYAPARPAVDTDAWLESAPSLAGLRVLVVDDEADGREVVAAVLELCGALVRAVGSAGEAFDIVVAESPDVLVADIEMPEEDGYSLLRRIRALPPESGGQIPAVALTAYAGTHDRMKALNAGFGLHVAKPVQPAELATVVANLAATPRQATRQRQRRRSRRR